MPAPTFSSVATGTDEEVHFGNISWCGVCRGQWLVVHGRRGNRWPTAPTFRGENILIACVIGRDKDDSPENASMP